MCMYAQPQGACMCAAEASLAYNSETGDVLLPGCWADLRLKGLNRKGTKAGEPEGEGERMSHRDDNVA